MRTASAAARLTWERPSANVRQSAARPTPASRTGLDGHVNYMLVMRNEREDLVAIAAGG